MRLITEETELPPQWKLSTVGEACQIRDELRFPLSVEQRREMQGEYPYYGPTGLLDGLNEYRVDGTFALIGEDGDHFLKFADWPMTQLVSGRFNVNNHAHLIEGKNGCTTEWFFYFFHHIDLKPLLSLQGVGRYKLTRGALEKLPIAVPPLAEQSAIAAVLSAWDRAIGQTAALIAAKQRLKKGLMQQLLTGIRRFRIFGDKWHRHELSDLCEAVKRKNGSTTTRVLTASGEHGMVDQLDYFHRSVAGRDIADYYLLQRGEFAYNRSLMNGYPFGAIKRLEKYEHGALSTLYLCFAVKMNSCDSDFMAQLFEGGVLNSQLRSIVQVGGRAHGLLNVSASEFFAMTVRLPELEEQRRIAEVLNLVDDEIALHRQRQEELKKHKRGLMQQLLTGKLRVPESLLRKGAAT